jgi:A/G-specific adenine glycosylase
VTIIFAVQKILKVRKRKLNTRHTSSNRSSANENLSSLVAEQKIRSLVACLLDWFSKNARDLPWRRTRDPYAIWVSEIMLQQTQVKTVLPYWTHWMCELPTIAALASASEAKLHKLWEGLGYYMRVRNLQKAARAIVDNHGGRFPENFDDILELPGIGRYTAGAICSIAFDQPKPILDGNVIRVLTRIFGIQENPREKKASARLWQLAEALVLEADKREGCSHLNQSLMELGALICTPRNPNCAVCPASAYCIARRENRQEQFPNPAKRIAMTPRRFIALLVNRRGRFLVRQRPAIGVNAHLWEFPNIEVSSDSDADSAAASIFGASPMRLEKFCIVKHSITRYRMTLETYRADFNSHAFDVSGKWLPLRNLDSLAFTSAHRKVLDQIQAATVKSQ